MGGRTAILTGLLAGVVVGGLAIAALLLLAPMPADPTAAATPPPAVPSPTAATPPPSTSPTTSPTTTASPSPGEAAFGVGQPAPALDVEQLGGGRIDLASLRGKPVWVNFMATWCPSCRDELPLMAGFAQRYSDTGLVIVAIDVREDESTVDAFIRGLGVGLPVGLDVDGQAQSAWGAYALPVHFWVGADGIVRDGALGAIGPDVMVTGLKAILPGVDVTTP